MPAINFTMFVDKVEAGTKRQTIRATTTVKRGDLLKLYTGMRTKKARKIGQVLCHSVEPIVLMERVAVRQGHPVLTEGFLDAFAQADGFARYKDMWDFFSKRADSNGEFHGFLIKWG